MMYRNFLKHSDGNYVIITDVLCDLSREEKIAAGIWPDFVPCSVTSNGKEVDISDMGDFYRKLEDKTYPASSIHTASFGPDRLEKILEDVIRQTPENVIILYVGTNPYISAGTSNSANIAIEETKAKHPERDIRFLNSLCTSNGEALFMQYLADYEGPDIEGYCNYLGKHLIHLFTQSRFDYSIASGRYKPLTNFALRCAGGLKLGLSLHFPYDDRLSPHKLFRGDKLFEEWARYWSESCYATDAPIRIGYGGDDAKGRVDRLVERLEEKGASNIYITHIGPSIGAHTGPDCISLFFRTRDDVLRPAKGSEDPLHVIRAKEVEVC